MKNKSTVYLVVVVFLLVAFLWAEYAQQATTPASTQPHPDIPIKSGPPSAYPNLALTPGDTLTVDAQTVCTSGYSSTVRNVPLSEKKQVYSEYAIPYPQPTGSTEVDHFIALELGGSNDIKNLWLEPAEPRPGFHEKDVVENYLHKQVCSGVLPLQEAQHQIATDWYAVYLKIAQ